MNAVGTVNGVLVCTQHVLNHAGVHGGWLRYNLDRGGGSRLVIGRDRHRKWRACNRTWSTCNRTWSSRYRKWCFICRKWSFRSRKWCARNRLWRVRDRLKSCGCQGGTLTRAVILYSEVVKLARRLEILATVLTQSLSILATTRGRNQ
jgi:hypothetical protein